MSIEQLEIVDFMKTCAPLDSLADAELATLAEQASTGYFRSEQTVLTAGKHNAEAFLICKGAVVFKNLNGEVGLQLDRGDWFGHNAMLQKGVMPHSVVSTEDCLCYVFPLERIAELMRKHDSVKTYFSEHSGSRLRKAVIDYRGDSQTQLISSQIEDIKLRASLQVGSQLSIIDTVKLMSEEKRSAVLIIDDNNLQGIATESDFCRKVIATGHDVHAPVSEVMTPNPEIVSGTLSASDALLLMAKKGVHHLPFRRQDGDFSTITASDLIQFQSHNPLFLITDIYGALTVDELKQHSRKIPELLTDLVNSSLAAYDIGHLISSIGEAINQRLIQLAEQDLGEAPVAYGWLVAGSLGRMEQTAHSDQDNALIFADDYDETIHKPYFEALAKFVCDGLDACGFVYCPGNIMASNPRWQMTAGQWRNQFMDWIHTPEPEALLYSTVFFDMRTIYGEASLLDSVMGDVLAVTGQQAPFMTHIAANALQFSPPLGLFRHFVLEKGGAEAKALNLKQRGVAPVTDLARTHALAGGIGALNTQDRLHAASAKGLISEQAKSDLVDAYAFISSVRLQHQCKQIEAGKAPDNFVPPELLSALEREHLKDAFHVVNTLQKYLRQRY
ncbi:MAG: nucleotidyltransferase [Gammaproteobacteria bacterium]|nr:MAG: nucleotidyltransferase [Gammaproteobacteria bacterium]